MIRPDGRIVIGNFSSSKLEVYAVTNVKRKTLLMQRCVWKQKTIAIIASNVGDEMVSIRERDITL